MEAQEGKYLTFHLDKEEYGIPILKVKEIIGMMEITRIPRTPDYIKGVINLRGKIIPIMDLRLKFGLEEKTYTSNTCIIVIDVNSSETKRQMGIVVDTVSEVVNLRKGDIEPPPEYSRDTDDSFITGICKFKNNVIILLNMDEILNVEGLIIINKDEGSCNSV